MIESLSKLKVEDGERVAVRDIAAAVTAGELVYDDGARQTFESDGQTEYVENGGVTHGRWSVEEDSRFCSFWPPSYRAYYELYWVVTHGAIVGLRFTELDGGSEFTARYQ